MPVQKVSGTIEFQETEIEVTPFSEIQLYMIAEFIRCLKEAEVTPNKWYAVSSLLGKLIPYLEDNGFVEIDQFEKTGSINLKAQDLDQLYKGLFGLWSSQTEGKEITLDVSSVDSETVESLQARLKALEATSNQA